MREEGGRGGAPSRTVVLALLALWASSGRSQDEALTERLLQRLAAGVESSGVQSDVLALGPAGALALRAAFEREDAPSYVRLRALTLLRAFESVETARYFEALVQRAQRPDPGLGALHPARSPLVLRRALEGLLPTVRLLAPLSSGEIIACLAHPDAHVRRAAADLLAVLDGGLAQRALEKQLLHERSALVRGRVERALTSRPARPRGSR